MDGLSWSQATVRHSTPSMRVMVLLLRQRGRQWWRRCREREGSCGRAAAGEFRRPEMRKDGRVFEEGQKGGVAALLRLLSAVDVLCAG